MYILLSKTFHILVFGITSFISGKFNHVFQLNYNEADILSCIKEKHIQAHEFTLQKYSPFSKNASFDDDDSHLKKTIRYSAYLRQRCRCGHCLASNQRWKQFAANLKQRSSELNTGLDHPWGWIDRAEMSGWL